MKKKTVPFLMVLLLILSIFPTTSIATTSGDYEYTDNGNGTCTITDYTGTGGDLTIPESIDGLTVTHIGEEAFL